MKSLNSSRNSSVVLLKNGKLFGSTVLFLSFALALSSCVTMTNGADFWTMDFGNSGKNYRNLDAIVRNIKIGMTKEQLLLLDSHISLIEETRSYQTYAIEEWTAVVGEDYIDRILYFKLISNSLDGYRLERVPRTTIQIPVIIW